MHSLDAATRQDEQLRYWAEAWRIITEDMAVMSLFFVPQPIAARKGVEGVFPAKPGGQAEYRVHTWDIK